jgi:hypothetical protein
MMLSGDRVGMIRARSRPAAASSTANSSPVAYRSQWLAQAEELLVKDWDGDVGQVRHAIAMAMDFRTWQLLMRKRRLHPDEAIRLMLAMVEGAART